MRLGFGENSGKNYIAIDSNHIQQSIANRFNLMFYDLIKQT